jgi:hypothetical protein
MQASILRAATRHALHALSQAAGHGQQVAADARVARAAKAQELQAVHACVSK